MCLHRGRQIDRPCGTSLNHNATTGVASASVGAGSTGVTGGTRPTARQGGGSTHRAEPGSCGGSAAEPDRGKPGHRLPAALSTSTSRWSGEDLPPCCRHLQTDMRTPTTTDTLCTRGVRGRWSKGCRIYLFGLLLLMLQKTGKGL